MAKKEIKNKKVRKWLFLSIVAILVLLFIRTSSFFVKPIKPEPVVYNETFDFSNGSLGENVSYLGIDESTTPIFENCGDKNAVVLSTIGSKLTISNLALKRATYSVYIFHEKYQLDNSSQNEEKPYDIYGYKEATKYSSNPSSCGFLKNAFDEEYPGAYTYYAPLTGDMDSISIEFKNFISTSEIDGGSSFAYISKIIIKVG